MIRMVSIYHMGDQPTSFPEEFDLSEDSEEIEIEYFGRVLRVVGEEVQEERREFEEFWIGNEDDEVQECDDGSDDAWRHWYEDQEQQSRNQERGYFYEYPNGCHRRHRTPWHPHMQEYEYGCHHPPRRNSVDRNLPRVEGTNFVRAARREGPREIEVVLDSGADISLAPI